MSMIPRSWKASPWWLPGGMSAQQDALLDILAVAHQERLDPCPLITLLASEQRWPGRRKLDLLAMRMRAGAQPIYALEQTPDALPDAEVLALRFALQSGTLSETYHELLTLRRAVHARRDTAWAQTLAYFGTILLFICFMTTLLATFVVPTFHEIWEELGLPENFFQWSFAQTFSILGQTPALIGLSLVVFGTLFVILRRPIMRTLNRTYASRLFGSVTRMRIAQVLRLLASSEQAGRPTGSALSTLARYHFDSNIRRKLLFARNEVEQGESAWESLRLAGLLRAPEAASITRASPSTSRAWLMRRLAGWMESHVSRQRAFWLSLLHPALVLLCGLGVMWIALVFFGYLVSLTTSLT